MHLRPARQPFLRASRTAPFLASCLPSLKRLAPRLTRLPCAAQVTVGPYGKWGVFDCKPLQVIWAKVGAACRQPHAEVVLTRALVRLTARLCLLTQSRGRQPTVCRLCAGRR